MPARRTMFAALGTLALVLCLVAGHRVYRTVTTHLMVMRVARDMSPLASPAERLRPPMTARYLSVAAAGIVTSLAETQDAAALAAGLAPIGDWAAVTVRTAAVERFDTDWVEGVEGIDDAQPAFMDPASERPTLDWTATRTTGTAFRVLARRARIEGRADEAARLLLASLALPRQLEALARREGQGFALLDAMVATAIVDGTALELLALAQAPGLPPDLLTEADRRLGAVDARFSLAGRAMSLERTSGTGVFRHMNREVLRRGGEAPFDVEAIQAEFDETMPPDATFDLPVRHAMPLWEEAAERRAEFEELGLFDYASVLWNPARLVSRVLMAIAVPSLDRAQVREAGTRARLRGALVAWHLAAHRARGGSLPPTLAACDPPIPEPMTTDPFTGEPLAYAVADGLAVLSANDQPGSGAAKLSRLSLLPPSEP